MKYKTRPGVVLTKVCGTSLLVPNREASTLCPYVIRLPFLWASTWKALQKGDSIETICKAHSILTHKSEEEAGNNLDDFLKEMCEKGFLIQVEDEE